MLIRDDYTVRLPVNKGGNISTGMMGENNLPKKLDYFNVEGFPELIEMYGEKPTKFVVQFPTDNMLDFIEERWCKWGKPKAGKGTGTKIRVCDGVECVHRIAEEVAGQSYKAGERTACICDSLGLHDTDDEELAKKACKYEMYIKVFITNPKTGKIDNMSCYQFEHHSINSGTNIKSAIANTSAYMRTALGLSSPRIAFIPFELSVRMVESSAAAGVTFPVWDLRCAYDTGIELIGRLKRLSRSLGWGKEFETRLLEASSLAEEDTLGHGIEPALGDVPALGDAAPEPSAAFAKLASDFDAVLADKDVVKARKWGRDHAEEIKRLSGEELANFRVAYEGAIKALQAGGERDPLAG